MRKIGVFILFTLLLVLSACGSNTTEGKLNKDGGFVVMEDHSLEILDFDVKDGKGTVDIKRYFFRYYFDEDEISESVEQYKVSVDEDEILIHAFLGVEAELIDDELHVFGGFTGNTQVYTYANEKEINKLLKKLEVEAENSLD